MEKQRLNIRQVLLTAVVTCIFTVIAGVATYLLTTKSASLSYTVSSGPLLSSGQAFKRIFSVSVENSGRKEVDSPTLQFCIPDGTISEASCEIPPGLTATEFKTNDIYRVSLPSLNPQEHLGASLMVYIKDASASPHISVRGVGVTGQESKAAKTDNKQFLFLIAGALASVLAMILSISPLMRKIIGRSTPPAMISRAFLRNEGMIGPFERNELIAFICGLAELPDPARLLRFSPSEISFRGAADYLVSEALATNDQQQEGRLLLALQSMLLIGSIAPDSIEVIQTAIKLLTRNHGDVNTEDIIARAVHPDGEPARLREVLIDYIRSNGKKLPPLPPKEKK